MADPKFYRRKAYPSLDRVADFIARAETIEEVARCLSMTHERDAMLRSASELRKQAALLMSSQKDAGEQY